MSEIFISSSELYDNLNLCSCDITIDIHSFAIYILDIKNKNKNNHKYSTALEFTTFTSTFITDKNVKCLLTVIYLQI